jgi:O-antigen ligase
MRDRLIYRSAPLACSALLISLLLGFIFEPLLQKTSFYRISTALLEVPSQQMAVVAVLSLLMLLSVFSGRGRLLQGLFFGLLLLHYCVDYHPGTQSINSVTLMAGLLATCVACSLPELSISYRLAVICAIPWLILIGSLLPGNNTAQFQYYGVLRLTGIWRNPNVFGLLIAAAFVISLGLLLVVCPLLKDRMARLYCRTMCVTALICLAYLLVFSFSRGAWLAACFGMAFLLYPRLRQWFYKRGPERAIALLVGAAGCIALVLWTAKFVETPLLRRLGSSLNAFDFSVANRITAYKAALDLLWTRPFWGCGWEATMHVLSVFSPVDVRNDFALSTNSYLKLAVSLGLPALYLLLALLFRAFGGMRREPTACGALQTTARAGLIVCAVGFWFDGGLLTAATWPVFWTLLGLSLGSFAMRCEIEVEKSSEIVKP